MDSQQITEIDRPGGGRRLPDHDQGEPGVVDLLEKIFDGAVRPELHPQPWEAIARARRVARKPVERLRQ